MTQLIRLHDFAEKAPRKCVARTDKRERERQTTTRRHGRGLPKTKVRTRAQLPETRSVIRERERECQIIKEIGIREAPTTGRRLDVTEMTGFQPPFSNKGESKNKQKSRQEIGPDFKHKHDRKSNRHYGGNNVTYVRPANREKTLNKIKIER